MIKGLGKIAGSLVLVLAMLSALCLGAAADVIVDWDALGSITIAPKSTAPEHNYVKDTSFTLYQVATAQDSNGAVTLILTDGFQGSNADLSDLSATGLAQTLAEYAKSQKLTGTTQAANEKGKVVFEQLPLGLYLLVQEEAAQGYRVAEPFLLMIPVSGDNGWEYNVKASPKTEPEETVEITVKKVWNDGESKDRPTSIKVQLYLEDVLLDTVELNAQNNWSYTWTDMEKDELYAVREVPVEGYKATYRQNGLNFTVTNTPALVQTGQLNWPIPVLAGTGLVLVLAGWLLLNRKKTA